MAAHLSWSLVLVTTSSQEPISLADAKSYLRIATSSAPDDDAIDVLVSAARSRLETRWRRAFLKQSWDLWMDEFPAGAAAIELPRAPLSSITHVRYFTDTDSGAGSTGGRLMASSEYYVDTAREPGRVKPFGSYSWPSGTRILNAGVVRFESGYSSQSSGVPASVRTAILDTVAQWFERRGDETFDPDLAPVPLTVRALDDDLALPDYG